MRTAINTIAITLGVAAMVLLIGTACGPQFAPAPRDQPVPLVTVRPS